MKKLYEFELELSAHDKLGINQKITDHIEIKYEGTDKPGDLMLWVQVEADSKEKAFEKAKEHLDEFFDFYCALKGSPLYIHPADEIRILKPKFDFYNSHNTIPYYPYTLTRRGGDLFIQIFKNSEKEDLDFLL